MSCQEAGCSFVQFNCSLFPVLRYILNVYKMAPAMYRYVKSYMQF